LEFPDVFARPGSGFNAVVGNPPWEIQKPSSKEFFSNLDPLYRTYGKQEALGKQTEGFRRSKTDEHAWLTYNARFKALSNWTKHAAFPFGDASEGGEHFSIGRGRVNEQLHDEWRARRAGRRGYADLAHPFRYQGSADINTYKIFLEQAHALLQEGGRLGFLTPSGLYTDKGTTALRTLFLQRCSWHWLFGFENREKVFDIDSRFKFCPLIVQKGGSTDAIHATFMHRTLADWEDGEQHVIPYARAQVERFSPKTRAILEIRGRRDLEVLEKIYAKTVLLGDESDAGWQIDYATEFHMTSDSTLFLPRPKWETEGYQPDEYSRWLKGRWRPREKGCRAATGIPRWELEPGVILSRNGTQWIHESEIEEVALPLYEGRMIGQFDFSQKGWVSGKGRGAVWRDIPWDAKVIEPQYCMRLAEYTENLSSESRIQGLTKVAFMDVTSATNERTMIASVVAALPCGNSAPVLYAEVNPLGLAAVLNAFAYDYVSRARCGGLHLNYFVIEETQLFTPSHLYPVAIHLSP
jgi:Eco57I restriction-modification methylase